MFLVTHSPYALHKLFTAAICKIIYEQFQFAFTNIIRCLNNTRWLFKVPETACGTPAELINVCTNYKESSSHNCAGKTPNSDLLEKLKSFSTRQSSTDIWSTFERDSDYILEDNPNKIWWQWWFELTIKYKEALESALRSSLKSNCFKCCRHSQCQVISHIYQYLWLHAHHDQSNDLILDKIHLSGLGIDSNSVLMRRINWKASFGFWHISFILESSSDQSIPGNICGGLIFKVSTCCKVSLGDQSGWKKEYQTHLL